MPIDNVPDDVANVFGKFIYQHPGGYSLGRDGSTLVSYFLDVMSASLNASHLDLLTKCYATFLEADPSFRDVETIAVPKRGNVLLGYSTAKLLGRNCIIVKDSILFNRWIEGTSKSGATILIDDIASDGELLQDAVYALRHAGILAVQAYVLVERPEGTTSETMRWLGTGYRAFLSLDDNDLAELLRRHRAQAVPASQPQTNPKASSASPTPGPHRETT